MSLGSELVVEEISHSFGDLSVLHQVSLRVEPGGFAAIVGPSGCGKSTLLRMMAGLENPQKGRITVGGRPVQAPGPDKMLVFQTDSLYPWRTVAQNVAFGLELAGLGADADQREAVRQIIMTVGLEGFESYYPHQLSGGMRQRAALAGALVMGPPLLLLDEPFGSLDAITKLSLQNQLKELCGRTDMTVVLVTHDIEEAAYLADWVYVMSPRPGRIIDSVRIDISKGDRDRGSSKFGSVKRHILDILGLGTTRKGFDSF